MLARHHLAGVLTTGVAGAPPPLSRRQAEADAVVLSRLLESAGQHVAAQLAAARAEAEAGRAEAAAARRQLAKQVAAPKRARACLLSGGFSCLPADLQVTHFPCPPAALCTLCGCLRASSCATCCGTWGPLLCRLPAGRALQGPAQGGSGPRGAAAAAAAAPSGGAAHCGACWCAAAGAVGGDGLRLREWAASCGPAFRPCVRSGLHQSLGGVTSSVVKRAAVLHFP